MASRIPMREPIGVEFAKPTRVFEFGDFIGKRLKKSNDEDKAEHVGSGLISGGKLGQPTLWSVLDILGVSKDFDEYLLGKFQRGHDVEARAINFLTGLEFQYVVDIITGKVENPGWIPLPEGSMLTGEVYLQMPTSYRGSIGYIDLAQRNGKSIILHEIKSATKMAYDRVVATGRSSKGTAAPYYHHCIQLALYALGDETSTDKAFLHYFNADDYRLATFAIDPQQYKAELDAEMTAIQRAFITKVIPNFEGFLDYHKAYVRSTFGAWNELNEYQILDKLMSEFPEAYKQFMNTTLPTGGGRNE